MCFHQQVQIVPFEVLAPVCYIFQYCRNYQPQAHTLSLRKSKKFIWRKTYNLNGSQIEETHISKKHVDQQIYKTFKKGNELTLKSQNYKVFAFQFVFIKFLNRLLHFVCVAVSHKHMHTHSHIRRGANCPISFSIEQLDRISFVEIHWLALKWSTQKVLNKQVI